MTDINNIGSDWVINEIQNITDEVIKVSPSEYNELHRYLPSSVTKIPGYLRYDVTPFTREIVDCLDIDSPIREINVKKGVQVSFTVSILEAGILYFAGHLRNLPMMYTTVDKESAEARIENYVLPMFNQSKLEHIIKSSDTSSKRKTGNTKKHLQFEGGGFLIPQGAKNADKMRSWSIAVMFKDEIDGWPDFVGKDGDPDDLTDDRLSAFWDSRKILRGSSPLILGTSKIERKYLQGDQRKYFVRCKKCGKAQVIKFERIDIETGKKSGFKWDYVNDQLDIESVRYCCMNCYEPHFEHDKENLFSPESGAEWRPTAKPINPYIRSYHLPAFYSPIGMAPWHKCVSDYLAAFDPIKKKVVNIKKYQTFYNNILGEPFEMKGKKVRFEQVSGHRRTIYRKGEIPNLYAQQYSGSKILFLTCTVDVHKRCLIVKIAGWCKNAISYVIDYFKIESKDKNPDADCRTDIKNNVWQELREVIERKEIISDDNTKYRLILTGIDANGQANKTVVSFCSEYVSGVIPILGRERTAKSSKIMEFSDFTTADGTEGKLITVDIYKDRLAATLRRNWTEEDGLQDANHFNAPVDMTDDELKELNAEVLRKKTDEKGRVSWEWHRPGGKPNELWDLTVYDNCLVDVMAYEMCVKKWGYKNVEWPKFWKYIEEEELYFQKLG